MAKTGGWGSEKCAHPLCTGLKWQLGWEDLACAHHSQTPDEDGDRAQSYPKPRPFVGEGTSVSQHSPLSPPLTWIRVVAGDLE